MENGKLAGLGVCLLALTGCTVSPGERATDFLTDDRPKMVIEIDHQANRPPADSAVNLLRQRSEERLHKPEGITFRIQPIQANHAQWTVEELQGLEKQNRDLARTRDTAALYVLVLGGSYGGHPVLGVAYGPSSIAIFKDNIERANTVGGVPLFAADALEESVLIHEFGHILGLVNIGTPMVRPHEMTMDPKPETPHHEGRGHSTNMQSVMWWQAEAGVLDGLAGGGPPNQFDTDDIADLRAAGGR